MIDERTLRSRLQEAATTVHPSSDLYARFERRVVVRRRRRRGALTGLAVVALTAVVASTTRAGDDSFPVATATPRGPDAGWSRIGSAPLESRFQHAAVAMGEHVLYFGGVTSDGDEAKGAAIYSPGTGTWEVVKDPPGSMAGSSGVWTGSRVLAMDTDGALISFDPVTKSWSPESQSPFRAASSAVTVLVWAEDKLVVINSASGARGTATYDPATHRWRELRAAPHELAFFDAVWTGAEVLVVADVDGSGLRYSELVAYRLDLEKGVWEELPDPPLSDVERRGHGFAVWTGQELIVGGGHAVTEQAEEVGAQLAAENRDPTPEERKVLEPTTRSDVAAWSPSSSTWRRVPDAPVPVTGLSRYRDIWTGDRVIAWSSSHAAMSSEPVLLDPATGMWSLGDPVPGGMHQEAPMAWTGQELLVWSGEPAGGDSRPMECCEPTSDGYAFKP